MKQFLLGALLLGGCAAIQYPRKTVVAPPIPAVIEVMRPESAPVPLTISPNKPVAPLETTISMAKATRYVLEYPQTYTKYLPRVEKFFKLALVDSTVLNKSTFDFSDATPTQIKERISGGFNVKITTYKPSIWKGGKWSSVIGYHSAGTIYLNSFYINRPDCEIINTIAHETMHNLGYSHGNNSSEGKDNSVPYWTGDRAQELCSQGKI